MLPVLNLRMRPLDAVPAQIGPAWQEAQRLADLLHLDAQAHLDRATAALPDPRSWAAEETIAAAPVSAKSRASGSRRSAGRAQASRKKASAA